MEKRKFDICEAFRALEDLNDDIVEPILAESKEVEFSCDTLVEEFEADTPVDIYDDTDIDTIDAEDATKSPVDDTTEEKDEIEEEEACVCICDDDSILDLEAEMKDIKLDGEVEIKPLTIGEDEIDIDCIKIEQEDDKVTIEINPECEECVEEEPVEIEETEITLEEDNEETLEVEEPAEDVEETTVEDKFDKAYNGSWYTIQGCGGDLEEWKEGYQKLFDEQSIGTIKEWIEFTGAEMNEKYHLTGDNAYPDDLHCLAFNLDGLDIGKLAMFKIRMRDRWFDDIVDNNAARENKEESLTEGIDVDLNDKESLEAGKEELKKEKEEPVEEIVDVNANFESEVKKDHVGEIVFECAKCHGLKYINKEDIIKDEEHEDLYNIEDECPHCHASEGWYLGGQIAKKEDEISAEEDADMFDENNLNDTLADFGDEEPTRDELAVEESEPVFEEPVQEESLTEEAEDTTAEVTVPEVEETEEVKAEVEEEPVEEKPAEEAKEEKPADEIPEESREEIGEEPQEENCDLEDKDLEDFDEEKFESLTNKYIKEVYENVDTFKTTAVNLEDKKLVVEGIVKFKSGREMPTSFNFSCRQLKCGDYKLVGLNESFAKDTKAFIVIAENKDNVLSAKKMTYSYLHEGIEVKGTVINY